MGIGWGYDYWHHSDYSIPTRRLITILLTLHPTNVVAFSRNNKWKTSIFRRYRSEWFTPWLMLTTTRWTRDLHPLHRWSISSKMTSSCLIDVEGDTASQHEGPTANVQPNYKYGSRLIGTTTSTEASQGGLLDYHNSATYPEGLQMILRWNTVSIMIE